MSEAALLLGDGGFEGLSDGLAVGVGGRQPQPPGDAVDVRVDGKDAAASAGEQQDAVGRLRPDAVHPEECLSDLRGRRLPDEAIESRRVAVLLEDPFGDGDDALRFLVVQPRRGDGLGQLGLGGVGQVRGEVPAAVALHQRVVGRLARYVRGILTEDRPNKALKAVATAVPLLPVHFAELVDDSLGTGPRTRGVEVGLSTPPRIAAGDVLGRFVFHVWVYGRRHDNAAFGVDIHKRPRRVVRRLYSRLNLQNALEFISRREGRDELPVNAGGGGVGPNHHRPVINVVAGPGDHAPVAPEGQLGMARPLDSLLAVADTKRCGNRRLFGSAGFDEGRVELRRDRGRFNREDAVAGRCQPVVTG